MIAAFAVGSRIAAGTEAPIVAVDQIQSAVLPMADDGVDESEFDVEPAGQDGCHPAYVDCVPLDLVEDLDCEDLTINDVRLQNVGWDPYALDDNGDGVGCESS